VSGLILKMKSLKRKQIQKQAVRAVMKMKMMKMTRCVKDRDLCANS
jgi:hypothetical protein